MEGIKSPFYFLFYFSDYTCSSSRSHLNQNANNFYLCFLWGGGIMLSDETVIHVLALAGKLSSQLWISWAIFQSIYKIFLRTVAIVTYAIFLSFMHISIKSTHTFQLWNFLQFTFYTIKQCIYTNSELFDCRTTLNMNKTFSYRWYILSYVLFSSLLAKMLTKIIKISPTVRKFSKREAIYRYISGGSVPNPCIYVRQNKPGID